MGPRLHDWCLHGKGDLETRDTEREDSHVNSDGGRNWTNAAQVKESKDPQAATRSSEETRKDSF